MRWMPMNLNVGCVVKLVEMSLYFWINVSFLQSVQEKKNLSFS